MAGRNGPFLGGVHDPINKITYDVQNIDGTVHASATDHDGEAESSGAFEYDPDTKAMEVVPGSLNIHPRHQGLDMGRVLRRLVNARH